jgi:hypothetical protein
VQDDLGLLLLTPTNASLIAMLNEWLHRSDDLQERWAQTVVDLMED